MEAVTADVGRPVVLKEQTFLETYFDCLSRFSHDKAKEMIEREREATKNRASLLWSSTLHLLNTLATSEKEFFSLVFLSPNLGSRLLGRKDALRTTYGCLLTELRKIENLHKTMTSKSGTGENLELLLGQLSGQLHHYIVARINTITFYEQILAASSKVNVSHSDLHTTISDIGQMCQRGLQHPMLSSLKQAFDMECSSAAHLLLAHGHLQKLQFLQTLHSLYDAHVKLTSWGNAIGCKEVKKLGFVSTSSKTCSPELYEWLLKYKGLLVAKFSLVFYDVLSRYGSPNEIKLLQSKMFTDFYGRLVAFHKKTDATSIALMLNQTDYTTTLQGFGYHLPDASSTSASAGEGDSSFLFSYPTDKPEKHWPALHAHTTTQKSQENNSDRLVSFYNEKFQSTYYLTRIDPGIILVAIFECKKQDRDNYITNFFQTIGSDLRCSKIYAMLKPGSK